MKSIKPIFEINLIHKPRLALIKTKRSAPVKKIIELNKTARESFKVHKMNGIPYGNLTTKGIKETWKKI